MVIVVIGVVYGGSVVEDEPVAFSRRDENDDLATQGTGIDYMKQFGKLFYKLVDLFNKATAGYD